MKCVEILPSQLTDNIRKMLPPDEKKRLGVAGLCMEELIERQTIKTEKGFQKQVAAYLRLKGVPFYQSRMDKRTTNRVGQPDFICCIAGRFLALECKQKGQEPTPEQWQEIEAIKAAGGFAWVVFSLSEVKVIIDELMREQPGNK